MTCLTEEQLAQLELIIAEAEIYIRERSNPDTGEFIRHADADDILEFLGRISKMIEPKPDPNWKEICKKCCEGESVENLPYCEYYGEPDGCNSPVYGEHPIYGDTRQLWYSNMQKMRAAIKVVQLKLKCWADHNPEPPRFLSEIQKAIANVQHLRPRNCDRFATEEEALRYYQNNVPEDSPYKGSVFKYITWLFTLADPNEETKKDDGQRKK